MKAPKSKPRATALRSRVLLVEDHAIVREGFAELINSDPSLKVCGAVSSAPEAVSAVEQFEPDAVVVDLSLQGGSGLELLKDLKTLRPELPLLVLSMHEEGLYAERALRAGARGYVMKREESKTVLDAIHTVLRGEVYLSTAMQHRLLHRIVGQNRAIESAGLSQLSDRELEVFELMGDGITTRQIAAHLGVSVSTVETHRARIKEKLHLKNAAELMRAAVAAAKAP